MTAISFETIDEAEERALFEAILRGPPYEFEAAKFDRYDGDAMWSGNYKDCAVDLAWCAWRERAGLK